MEYLLFIFQEANFQSRSALIPAEPFLKLHQADWDLLKSYSREELLDGHIVPNVLWEEIQWEGNRGSPVQTPFSNALHDLQGGVQGYPRTEEDLTWCRYGDWIEGLVGDKEQEITRVQAEIYTDFCGGFDHVETFLEALKMTSIDSKPIRIVDSLLVLERNLGLHGQQHEGYQPPPFKTVEQLLDFYVQNDIKETNKEN